MKKNQFIGNSISLVFILLLFWGLSVNGQISLPTCPSGCSPAIQNCNTIKCATGKVCQNSGTGSCCCPTPAQCGGSLSTNKCSIGICTEGTCQVNSLGTKCICVTPTPTPCTECDPGFGSGSIKCQGNNVQTCNVNASGCKWVNSQTCPLGCSAGTCITPTPTPCMGCGPFFDPNGTVQCGSGASLLKCNTAQNICAYEPFNTCPSGQVCTGDPSGTCPSGATCYSGSTRCICGSGTHQCPSTGSIAICCPDNLAGCNGSSCPTPTPTPDLNCGGLMSGACPPGQVCQSQAVPSIGVVWSCVFPTPNSTPSCDLTQNHLCPMQNGTNACCPNTNPGCSSNNTGCSTCPPSVGHLCPVPGQGALEICCPNNVPCGGPSGCNVCSSTNCGACTASNCPAGCTLNASGCVANNPAAAAAAAQASAQTAGPTDAQVAAANAAAAATAAANAGTQTGPTAEQIATANAAAAAAANGQYYARKAESEETPEAENKEQAIEESSTESDTEKKCGECKPPDCTGKCDDPEKTCVTKFSKKKKKDVCKCKKQDAVNNNEEDDDSDEDESGDE